MTLIILHYRVLPHEEKRKRGISQKKRRTRSRVGNSVNHCETLPEKPRFSAVFKGGARKISSGKKRNDQNSITV